MLIIGSQEPPLDPPDVDWPEDDRTEDEIADADDRALSRIEDEDKARRKGTW